jgi:hypothetical protein
MKVREATYLPRADGGEIHATMQFGRNEVTGTWPVDRDTELQSLLDQLTVHVQRVSFVPGDEGGEIRATMTVGERTFVSRLNLSGDAQDIQPIFDRLLDRIGDSFVESLQSELGSGLETTARRSRSAVT